MLAKLAKNYHIRYNEMQPKYRLIGLFRGRHIEVLWNIGIRTIRSADFDIDIDININDDNDDDRNIYAIQ